MTTFPTVDPATQRSAFDAVYEEHYSLLYNVALHRFNVPPAAADDVVQEVFLSYLMARDSVRDARAWLVGGVCNASRGYWRTQAGRKEEMLEKRSVPVQIEQVLREVSVRQVMDRLHPKCRRTLELHYWEGATAREVAESLETTPRYAEKLIHQCLRKAWRAWHHLWSDA